EHGRAGVALDPSASTLSRVVARRLRHLLTLGFVVFVAAACEVAVDVVVDVSADGSGVVGVEVELDAEASARIPDLAELVRLDDLTEAGWTVEGPDDAENGGVVLRATKPFDEPSRLGDVLDEITGPGGAFQDFELSRTTEFAQTDFDISGTVDLSRGIDLFTDAELAESLDDRPFGIDLDALEREIGPLSDAVSFSFTARLPGTGEGGGGGPEISAQPRLGEPPVPLATSTTDEDEIAKLLRWVGYAAASLFVVAVVVNVVIALVEWRIRKNRPAIRTADPVRAPVPAGGAPAPTMRPGRKLGLVVIEVTGVLYEPMAGGEGAFARFARDHGSTLSDERLDTLLHEAFSGRISSAELWAEAGLDGDTAEVDAAFVKRVRLVPGARDFVRELRRRNMRVAALGNQVDSWAEALRERDSLGNIAPWVTSGAAGVTAPEPGLFEALRRATGVPYEDCLIIDSDLESLDTAKTLGMSTVWFTKSRPGADQRPDHAIVSGFADFFRRR
ncbi:MAG: hypothetical protein OEU32_17615, partial [Acidimicrobiia bacterium]|nr:hypothetical protein [Acidimicrobiia bacterium]